MITEDGGAWGLHPRSETHDQASQPSRRLGVEWTAQLWLPDPGTSSSRRAAHHRGSAVRACASPSGIPAHRARRRFPAFYGGDGGDPAPCRLAADQAPGPPFQRRFSAVSAGLP